MFTSGRETLRNVVRQRSQKLDSLLDSSSLLPGSIFVWAMSAGAMPLTVTPLLAYEIASQWIMP